MAGVDAILGSVSVRNLAASKGAASVTAANGTRQFENFLKDSGSAKNKGIDAGGSRGTGSTAGGYP